jgi:LuxR family maltose regulon positive regulatory protein
VPELRSGLVGRPRLVDLLVASRETRVVLVVAGPGYGKTTLLAQWAKIDDRPFSWVGLTPAQDDPAVLLATLAHALHAVDPLPTEELTRLTRSRADFTSVLLPRLARAVASRTQQFVLVLDDVHWLSSPTSIALVDTVSSSIPTGAQIALATRHTEKIAVGTMRARGEVTTVDATQLSMTPEEADTVLRSTGLELSNSDSLTVHDRTEGWPVAVYLAALALREQPDPGASAQSFAGDERLVVDYLRDELFATISDEIAAFLTRTAILDQMSGSLCDAVLERSGSSETLQSLERANLLVVPLDRTRTWFRYHSLLREKLLARLQRLDPEGEPGLHRRAALWYAEHGDPDRAVHHAARSDDQQLFDTLVWQGSVRLLASGQTTTVATWLDALDPEEISRRAALVVTAAWTALTAGDMRALERWVSIAEHITPDAALPDGSPFRAALLLLRAVLGRDGIARLRDDAASAYTLHRPDSPYRPIACVLEGIARRLLGDPVGARARFEEGEAAGRVLNPAAQAQCLGQLALLDVENADWEGARARVEEALAVVDAFGLVERPLQADLYGVAALVFAHDGETANARRELKHAVWLLSMLTTVGPWMAAESRILLARAALLIGDVALARVLCTEADGYAERLLDAGILLERAAHVRRMTDAESTPLGVSATPLTPAELRVLRYLPTHMSFAAIADELFVSRNTIKTQAISIYRKLGVSSRAPAVGAARELGILDA